MLVALSCVATVTGLISVVAGLVLAGAVFAVYVAVLGMRRQSVHRLPISQRWRTWILFAVEEEELELAEAIRPLRGRPVDFLATVMALVIVVIASVTMERSAVTLGHHFHVADAVIGAIVLAGVTSLPNAVAAVHLASKGRGAAALSTALNSNSLNVVVGLLIPGVFVGLARSSLPGSVTTWWYVGLTMVTLVCAFSTGGLRRWQGGLIITGYVAFVVVLLSIS
jgi:cation:H+ antiporter